MLVWNTLKCLKVSMVKPILTNIRGMLNLLHTIVYKLLSWKCSPIVKLSGVQQELLRIAEATVETFKGTKITKKVVLFSCRGKIANNNVFLTTATFGIAVNPDNINIKHHV